MQQAIKELTEHFNVTVSSITGNESRVGEFVHYSNFLAGDSYDCVIHNMLRVAFCHFHEKRIERVVAALKRYRDFANALSLFATSDVLLRRQSLERERVRDDQWFFERFPMSV